MYSGLNPITLFPSMNIKMVNFLFVFNVVMNMVVYCSMSARFKKESALT